MTLPETPRQLLASQAKSRLADCLRRVEHGEPVIIAPHGKPVAALVAVNRAAPQKAKNLPTGTGFAGLAGGRKGSENLVRAVGKLRRTRSRRPITLD